MFFILLLFFAVYVFDVQDYLTLEYLKKNLDRFRGFYQQHMVLTVTVFMVSYIFSTALSIPGATVFSLFSGALFGRFWGTVFASFATTIGGTLAFLSARFFLKDFVQAKFSRKLLLVNKGIERDGWVYLLILRLIPVFPFFVINLIMGVTPIGTLTFMFVSQLGMLAGTFFYVNTGVELSKINTLEDIFSLPIFIALSLLAFFPLLVRKLFEWRKRRKLYARYYSKRPTQYDYNMVVIGGGAAGLVTSYIGSMLQAKVALVEKGSMGGDCLNTGCVPSKTLIKAAKVAHQTRYGESYGLSNEEVNIDFSKVMERVRSVIKKIEPHDSVERYTGLGVDCLIGEAKIISPWEVCVGEKTFSARYMTIATGGEPITPPIPGLDGVEFLNSNNLWQLQELPKNLVVLGGGPIGLEMAQSFQRLGSQVTVVERGDHLLVKEDREVGEYIKECLEREGVNVLTTHLALEVKGCCVICQSPRGDKISIEFDKIFVAVGRRASVEGLGLKELGVELDPHGAICVNQYLQTNFPNIYACGDVVSGSYQLTHVAAHQAWYCAVNSLLGWLKRFRVNYSVIPRVTYTDPEVATVGKVEWELRASGVPYEVVEYDLGELDRALVDGQERGLIRVFVPPGKDHILGATIVGEGASNSIIEFVLGMRHGFGLKKILSTIHPYPSMVEGNKYVAGKWRYRNRPIRILRALEVLFTRIRRG